MDGPVFVVAPAHAVAGWVHMLSAAGLAVAVGDVDAALALFDRSPAAATVSGGSAGTNPTPSDVPAVALVDLALVDLALGDGAAAVAELAAGAPRLPVLALCPDGEHAGALAAVRAGAAGCVVRTIRARELAAAVRRTAAGEAVFSPGLAEVVLEAYGAPSAVLPRLTEREADVLRLVVDGLTARQIAGRLVLSPRTVENHIQRTLRKLRLSGRAALVRYAIENGLF